MDTGMLWFDNDKTKPIPTKIERAVEYYREKYEREPDTCYLNPQMFPGAANPSQKSEGQGEKKLSVGAIEVHPSSLILPNHFWIGINNGNGQSSPAG
ncbi:MAG: hypothetical protein MAG431_02143 [Chloroflexi bacterium]|nr:hypothetical protein [Chloroflexota bacterium]